jgi:hypothetical protein
MISENSLEKSFSVDNLPDKIFFSGKTGLYCESFVSLPFS